MLWVTVSVLIKSLYGTTVKFFVWSLLNAGDFSALIKSRIPAIRWCVFSLKLKVCATGGYIVTCHAGNKRRRQLALRSLIYVYLLICQSGSTQIDRFALFVARVCLCSVLLNVSRKHLLWRPVPSVPACPRSICSPLDYHHQCHCTMSFSQLPSHFHRCCLHDVKSKHYLNLKVLKNNLKCTFWAHNFLKRRM